LKTESSNWQNRKKIVFYFNRLRISEKLSIFVDKTGNMILEWVSKRTDDFIAQMPKSLRKQYGQFFTSLTTARFMASLFTLPKKKELNILDAGAGSGILSIALLERIAEMPDHMIHLNGDRFLGPRQ
jgi:ribosomal protein L11 methylase PrmA